MNSRTKKILLATTILLLTSIAIFAYLFHEIQAKGSLLGEYITVLDERDAQEASFLRIKRQVEETVAEREAIANTFFTDESDSISFLSEIETFAQSINLTLETRELDKVTSVKTQNEYITMTFAYSGDKAVVMAFTELLENVPYHAWLEGLTLEEKFDGDWEGLATLYISLQTP